VAQLTKQMEDAKKTIQETEELSRNIIAQVSVRTKLEDGE
jgi:hypothetical protein